jgi:hypothetical protein
LITSKYRTHCLKGTITLRQSFSNHLGLKVKTRLIVGKI